MDLRSHCAQVKVDSAHRIGKSDSCDVDSVAESCLGYFVVGGEVDDDRGRGRRRRHGSSRLCIRLSSGTRRCLPRSGETFFARGTLIINASKYFAGSSLNLPQLPLSFMASRYPTQFRISKRGWWHLPKLSNLAFSCNSVNCGRRRWSRSARCCFLWTRFYVVY